MSKLRAPYALTLALAVGLAACGTATEHELLGTDAAYELTETTPDGLVVLDVRTPEEHREARLEGSVLIDFYSPTFESELADLKKDVPYFVYCRSGNRSAQTVSLMKDLGFAEVYELEGGIQSWAIEGLPLVSS